MSLSASQAAAAGLSTGAGYYVVLGGSPSASPTLSQFSYVGTNKASITDQNRYDYAPTSQIVPTQNDGRGLLELTRDLSPGITGTVQVIWSDERTQFLYTPDTINSALVTVSNPTSLSTGANPAYLSIPAYNPYNPFGSALGGSSGAANSFLGRALFGPTRTYSGESIATGILGYGFGWLLVERLGPWSSGLSLGTNIVSVRAKNNILASGSPVNALDGTLSGYPRQLPQSSSVRRRTRLMVDSLFVTSMSRAQDKAADLDFSLSGPLWQLPKGELSFAAGSEWQARKGPNNAPDIAANYVVNPTSGSTPYAGSRTVASGFLELEAPVAGRYLELQAAVRTDHYSQFGGTTNPKLAASTRPFPWLRLRSSYSESYKAPDLGQLESSPATTYSATNTLDPLNPLVPANAYAQLQGGNPNLKPEKGSVWYEGWGGGFRIPLPMG